MATTTELLSFEPRRRRETPESRALRLARERELLEAGREDLRAGRSLSGPELDDWLEHFTENESFDHLPSK